MSGVSVEPRMIGMDEAVDLIAGLSQVQGGDTRDRVTRNLIVDLAYTVRVLRSHDEARQDALRQLVDEFRQAADDDMSYTDWAGNGWREIADKIVTAGLDPAW